MVAGNIKNSEIINILGGFQNPTNSYQYNITSAKTKTITTTLSVPVRTGSSGYTSVNNMIYWDCGGCTATVNNFYTYDMKKLVLTQKGKAHPKPIAIDQQCFTSNGVDTVYLMTGAEPNGVSKAFLTFNIKTYKWIQGPNLNIARRLAACLYHDDVLFTFGGYNDDNSTNHIAYNRIEMLNISLIPNKWELIDVNLSTPTDAIKAYLIAGSNTSFIIGGSFCNIFHTETLLISLCPQMYYSTNKFSAIYVEHLYRFYAIGGSQHGSTTNKIEYAMNNYTIPLNFSKSSKDVIIGNRVPIILSNYYDTNNYSVQLQCKLFNVNAYLTINTNLECTLCDSYYITQCGSCSNGILPIINGISVLNDIYTNATKTCNFNITANNNIFNLINGFNVTINSFINVSNSNIKISPGQNIPIKISNAMLVANKSYVFRLYSSNQALQVDNTLIVKTDSYKIRNCSIFTTSNLNPVSCDKGVYPQINYNFVSDKNNIFNIPLYPNGSSKMVDIIPSNGISVEISLCSSGYGMVSRNTANCVLCAPNTFTLKSGIKPCHHCDNDLDAVNCKGGNNVVITSNYWISSLSNSSTLYPLIDIQPYDSMYSIFCPPAFCCSLTKGCDYIELYNDTKYENGLCSKGRNSSTPLCGDCNDDLSVLFGTNDCGDCNKTNYGLLILVFVFICIPFTIYIAYFASAPTNVFSQYYDEYISNQIVLFNVLLFDIFFYYYQCLSIIFSSKGIAVSSWFESMLLSIFNLQLMNVNTSTNGICIIANIDAFHKLLFTFIYPISFLIPLIIILLIQRFTNLKLADYICCCFKCDKCSGIKQYFYRNAYILKSFIRLLLLYIATSISTLCQLLTVVKLPSNHLIHYYAPNKIINAWTIIIVVCCIIVILLIFLVFFYLLWKQNNAKKQSPNNPLRSFVSSFKNENWYWQFIIFSRRVIIAIFGAFQFLASEPSNITLAAFILIFIIIHVKIQPFKFKIANYMETMCLCSLELVLICLNFMSSINNTFSYIFASICIFIPLAVFLIFAIRTCYIWCGSDQNYCCKVIITSLNNDGGLIRIEHLSVSMNGYHDNNAILSDTESETYLS